MNSLLPKSEISDRRRGHVGAGIVLSILVCALVVSTSGASPEADSNGARGFSSAPDGPSAPDEVRAFMDTLMAGQLATNHIAGAMVVVVKGDQVLLAKGYGYADLEAQRSFDAAETAFPIGSTGKLVTWTAVMQLFERGKLDLDADVNTYLEGFSIPATYPEPVTLRHLMSHSAGFEDLNLGIVAFAPEEIVPLKEFLMHHVPARVRPPGQLTAYSNYGAALAGYIVEVVSGVPFEQYGEENIFGPLRMSRSSFRQPLPKELADHLSAGYIYNGNFVPQRLMYVSMRPAGSMSTTGEDIARFMIAHLQDGRFEGVRILNESTARLMHSRLFANEPRLSGFAYGFMDQQINGQRVLHHGGGLPPYFGMLALIPETQVGFYVGYNGLGDPPAAAGFVDRFFDHYYPQPQAAEPVTSAAFTSPEMLVGTYHTTRSNRTSLERVLDLSGMGYGTVTSNAEGTLEVHLSIGSMPVSGRFVETEPLLFISADRKEKIAFKTDVNDNATRMFLDTRPECAFEKIAWYEAPILNAAALIACMAIFAFSVLAGLVSWWRGRKLARSRVDREADRARRLGLALSAVSILTIAGLIALLAVGGFTSRPPVWIPGVLSLAWIAAVLSVLVVIFALRVWIRGYLRGAARLHYTVLAAAGVVFAVWMAQWNLLKFSW